MRKWWYKRILVVITVFATIMSTGFAVQSIYESREGEKVNSEDIDEEMVIPGGVPIGIYMETNGIYVMGIDEIEGNDGIMYSPAENIVQSGDYILEINGKSLDDKSVLVEEVKQLEDKEVILSVRRDGEMLDVKMNAVEDRTGTYKLGIWVKDNVQGLGTLTYLTDDHQFGALGHGIHDSDTDDLLQIREGTVYKASILGVEKSEYGSPGGLKGMIVYRESNEIGSIETNSDAGISGMIEEREDLPLTEKAVQIAEKDEIEIGPATMLCTIDDEVTEYSIEITNTDRYTKTANKEIMIEVTDQRLLDQTGGIVQGMSGSPILQNGKIIGAVTHVLVNNPAKGYAIWIGNMLE